MTVLGVIACEILELEVAHLIRNDVRVEQISVVEDQRSQEFLNALRLSGADKVERLQKVSDFKYCHGTRLCVLVRVLDIALHQRKSDLQDALIGAVKEMGQCTDGVLLGYGLCGNAIEQPEQLFADVQLPIFLPKDDDHPVDDCVGMVIGGRDEYYKEQCKVAGTFFVTAGWANHWKQMIEIESGGMGITVIKRMLADYERSLIVVTPIMLESTMREKVDGFNRLFGLRTEVRFGTLNILQSAWYEAIAHLLR